MSERCTNREQTVDGASVYSGPRCTRRLDSSSWDETATPTPCDSTCAPSRAATTVSVAWSPSAPFHVSIPARKHQSNRTGSGCVEWTHCPSSRTPVGRRAGRGLAATSAQVVVSQQTRPWVSPGEGGSVGTASGSVGWRSSPLSAAVSRVHSLVARQRRRTSSWWAHDYGSRPSGQISEISHTLGPKYLSGTSCWNDQTLSWSDHCDGNVWDETSRGIDVDRRVLFAFEDQAVADGAAGEGVVLRDCQFGAQD